jgi:hypothetical protein
VTSDQLAAVDHLFESARDACRRPAMLTTVEDQFGSPCYHRSSTMPAKTKKRPSRGKAVKARSTAAAAPTARATKRAQPAPNRGARITGSGAKKARAAGGAKPAKGRAKQVVARRKPMAAAGRASAARPARDVIVPVIPLPVTVDDVPAAPVLFSDTAQVPAENSDSQAERGPSVVARLKHGVGSLFARMTGRGRKAPDQPDEHTVGDRTMEITTEDIILSSAVPPPPPLRRKTSADTDEE